MNLAQRWRVLKQKESIQYYVKAIEQTEYLNEDSMHEDLAYLCYELAQFFRQIIREKPAKIFLKKRWLQQKLLMEITQHWFKNSIRYSGKGRDKFTHQ